MQTLKLTDDELTVALNGYASGKTTTQIIDLMLKAHPDWQDNYENRQAIRSALRPVNPSDSRFAMNKYGETYALAREAVLDVFRDEAREAFGTVAKSLTSNLEEYDILGETLLGMIDHASSKEINSNTEFLNTVRAFCILQKVKIEGVNAIAELVSQVAKLSALPSPKSDSS